MPGTPSTRRRKRARGADADAEGEGEGDEGSPAISSPATKKRPLIAATPTPPKSKKRRRPKAAAAIENKEEEEEDLDNGSPSKKVITPRIVKATTKRKSHYAVRFIDDAEADDLIRDIEKFSKRGRSAQNDDEADEENDSVAMFGKYPRQVHRSCDRGELKGSQVFGFKTPARRPKPDDKRKVPAPVVMAMERQGADAYFEANDGNPDSQQATSDRTLARLKTPRLSQEMVDELLAEVPDRYGREREALIDTYRAKFARWYQLLRQDFNIVLFGLGSKKSLLEEFRQRWLDDQDCVVVNGFFPSLTVKQILNAITAELLGHEGAFASVPEQVAFVAGAVRDRDVFLVVHNIDGLNLRGEKAQGVLAQLASIPRVHLVCSVDHINAPLIWDQQKISKFNFVWFDSTTFLPYSEETRNENSFMVRQSGALALNSLSHVFSSLTPNAKEIYLLIAKYQVEALQEAAASDADGYRGIAFNDLYRRCKSAFLVNSDLTLRAQLIEFKDHKLINVKKGADGYDYLSIPLNSATLNEFMEQQSSKE